MTQSDIPPTLAALREELTSELARLQETGERWLEIKASGRPTSSVEAELSSVEQNTRRLERRIHRQEKKLRR